MDVLQLLAVQIPSYHAQNTPKFRGFTQREKNMEVSSIRKRIQFSSTHSVRKKAILVYCVPKKIVYIILSLNSLSLAKFIKKRYDTK